MTESRVTCKRNHRLFEITPDGIVIKCRGCHTVNTIPWCEIDAKRQAVIRDAYAVTQSDHTTALFIRNSGTQVP